MIFLKKLKSFIINRFYVNETIILFELDKLILQTSTANICKINNNNLSDILNFQDEKSLNIFKDFLLLGYYYGYINNNCIHRSWLKLNEQIVQLHWASPYKLKQNEAFIHYCETALEARGKNIYPHVLSNIIKEHKDKKILIAMDDKKYCIQKRS